MQKDVEFSVDSQTLRGKFFIPEGMKNPPAVILFHGSGSKGLSLLSLAEKLMRNGFFTFWFNFRGCGISDGNFFEQTISDALKDARRAFDFMLDQSVDHDRIGVVGSSFGGQIATLILPEYPVKSLILKAPSATDRPLSSKIDMGSEEDEHNYFFVHKEKWEKSESFTKIADFEGNLLLIKSGNDNIIPKEIIQTYFDSSVKAKQKRMETIASADHRLSLEPWINEFTNISLEFLLETL